MKPEVTGYGIKNLRSLGPKTAQMLAETGITDVAALRRAGPVEAYARLKFHFGAAVTLNALYAIAAGMRGSHWRDLDESVKEKLRAEAKRRMTEK